MLLIVIPGGPSSLTIVPTPLHAPSREQSAPTTFDKKTKICSSGSTVVSPQIVILTLRVPFGVFGGIENGALLNGWKSTPVLHVEPPIGVLKPAPDNGIAETVPV